MAQDVREEGRGMEGGHDPAYPAPESLSLTLPWAPSVNTYWRRVGNRTILSKRARVYRGDVAKAFMMYPGHVLWATERLTVAITAFPPDRRLRDLDNVLKGLLDALAHAGVFSDDNQIDRIEITRGPRIPGGRIDVALSVLREP